VNYVLLRVMVEETMGVWIEVQTKLEVNYVFLHVIVEEAMGV
jgi:hypothetical protein